MRGKQASVAEFLADLGITPAHAGKTFFVLRIVCVGGDHPRACGENYRALFFSTHSRGSPPRMRGKHNLKGEKGMNYGITPAHAGKTGFWADVFLPFWDHPRACGENSRSQRFQLS